MDDKQEAKLYKELAELVIIPNMGGSRDGQRRISDDSMPQVMRIIKKHFSSLLHSQSEQMVRVTGETSDGYHTFDELYEFRKVYNAALFNEWASQGKYNVHKSKKHSDGEECFGGGWFIVMATPPTGQISNHYELKDWDLFDCEERETAEEWDGHTPKDVVKRLSSLKKGAGK